MKDAQDILEQVYQELSVDPDIKDQDDLGLCMEFAKQILANQGIIEEEKSTQQSEYLGDACDLGMSHEDNDTPVYMVKLEIEVN